MSTSLLETSQFSYVVRHIPLDHLCFAFFHLPHKGGYFLAHDIRSTSLAYGLPSSLNPYSNSLRILPTWGSHNLISDSRSCQEPALALHYPHLPLSSQATASVNSAWSQLPSFTSLESLTSSSCTATEHDSEDKGERAGKSVFCYVFSHIFFHTDTFESFFWGWISKQRRNQCNKNIVTCFFNKVRVHLLSMLLYCHTGLPLWTYSWQLMSKWRYKFHMKCRSKFFFLFL